MFKFGNREVIKYDDKFITDLTTQLKYNTSMINNSYYFISYTINDGDTPESICYKLYNDGTLDWILLEVNNIIDPFYDWPLTTYELSEFCKTKYNNAIYNIHHYELNGIVVNSTIPGAEPITNFDYENRKNDIKRKIKIPTEEFMNDFIFSYEII